MGHIEFLGAPGSGKSTIARALIGAWPGAVGLEEAVHRSIREHGGDPVTRTLARFFGPSGRVWKAAYGRSRDRVAARDRFRDAHPSLIEAFDRAQRARAGTDAGQDLVRGWADGFFARFQLAADLGVDALVIDEGFAQRSVALFGYGFSAEDEGCLTDYLETVPRAMAVVLVAAPIEVCASRLDARGWSQRVADAPPAVREGFLRASIQVAEIAAKTLEHRGMRILHADGMAPVQDSTSALVDELQV